ncbi:cleavage stimulation factor subunit 1 [Teleopsis dalmanni]|uniref:cleavage stimulation factor subunit 1 n=1 Tax=Teleopsis dalmanni TaxID=139649 RepID=UPI0018CFAED6|nr:cleavage stimulation factor subunit 1 [Teleopsis dalmanni]
MDIIDPRNLVKNREILYRLIISQLMYDGLDKFAVELSMLVKADECAPSERLLHVMITGMLAKREKEPIVNDDVVMGIDLEFEPESTTLAPEPASYETAYVTSHKQSCRAGAFSHDGTLVATGSVDASIKILDVERMLAKSAPEDLEPGREQQAHPVIRTLYDHTDEVAFLEFHPTEHILASGSRDCTVKLFDIAKPSVKKAHKVLTDCEPVTCLSFHPNGDFMVVGTEHQTLRIYDVETSKCYGGAIPSHQHKAAIRCVKFASKAKLYASGSVDGCIKIWDTVSGRCVNTILDAHGGAEICSLQFTRNGKYLLSSGKDSLVYLWELCTSRAIQTYTGAGTTGKQEHNTQAVFNHTEDYVLFPDEATTSLCSWNARNGARLNLMSLSHNGPVRYITHSPNAPAFLTCSDDYRARFWYRRTPNQ